MVMIVMKGIDMMAVWAGMSSEATIPVSPEGNL